MPVSPPPYRPPGLPLRHAGEDRRQHDKRRGTAASRGYGSRWRRERAEFLSDPAHAVCEMCRAAGLINPGIYRLDGALEPNERRQHLVVDHIRPHGGNPVLFWDRSNWQTLCPDHHDIVKQREEAATFRRG